MRRGCSYHEMRRPGHARGERVGAPTTTCACPAMPAVNASNVAPCYHRSGYDGIQRWQRLPAPYGQGRNPHGLPHACGGRVAGRRAPLPGRAQRAAAEAQCGARKRKPCGGRACFAARIVWASHWVAWAHGRAPAQCEEPRGAPAGRASPGCVAASPRRCARRLRPVCFLAAELQLKRLSARPSRRAWPLSLVVHCRCAPRPLFASLAVLCRAFVSAGAAGFVLLSLALKPLDDLY